MYSAGALTIIYDFQYHMCHTIVPFCNEDALSCLHRLGLGPTFVRLGYGQCCTLFGVRVLLVSVATGLVCVRWAAFVEINKALMMVERHAACSALSVTGLSVSYHHYFVSTTGFTIHHETTDHRTTNNMRS